MASKCYTLFGLASLGLVTASRSNQGVVEHAQFTFKNGVIEAAANTNFHLALNGEVKAGDALKLGECTVGQHKKFEIFNNQIRLVANPQMCLNAEGGVYQGADITTYPCSEFGKPSDNELFEHGGDGRIRALSARNLCMNIKEGRIAHGTGISLYECGSNPNYIHDIFGYKDQSFFVTSNPKLHLHVKDGNLQDISNIVLGGCDHADFHFDSQSKQIRLQGTDLCVNAENGVSAGATLIAWQCAKAGHAVPENQQFEYDPERSVITSAKEKNLGFNIKGANVMDGTPIVLYPLHTDM